MKGWVGVRRWQIPLCMCEGGEFTTGQGEVVTNLVRCEEVVTSGVDVREVVTLGRFEGGGYTPR